MGWLVGLEVQVVVSVVGLSVDSDGQTATLLPQEKGVKEWEHSSILLYLDGGLHTVEVIQESLCHVLHYATGVTSIPLPKVGIYWGSIKSTPCRDWPPQRTQVNPMLGPPVVHRRLLHITEIGGPQAHFQQLHNTKGDSVTQGLVLLQPVMNDWHCHVNWNFMNWDDTSKLNNISYSLTFITVVTPSR